MDTFPKVGIVVGMQEGVVAVYVGKIVGAVKAGVGVTVGILVVVEERKEA